MPDFPEAAATACAAVIPQLDFAASHSWNLD
jgi:hypothetical protein